MTLLEEQKEIISERPLGDTLDRVRDKLRDANEADDAYRESIASLLLALVGSSAAFKLPSPDGNSNVAARLFPIQQDLQGGKIANLDPFRPLVRLVVDNSNDTAIWAAVFSLLDTLTPRTPRLRPTVPSTFKGTPVKTSSNRLADSATCEVVEKELFHEIKNCTFRGVGGFLDKFFDLENWRNEQKAMLEKIKTAHNGTKWTGFPATPDEKPVWEWLCSLEERFLAGAPNKLHTTASAHQFKEGKDQMDIFFQASTTEAGTLYEYKNILVVGEQKKSHSERRFKTDFLQLSRYVRKVFADQPTRRFVHAFLLCASKMELWIFDRAGAYSSGFFDIHQNTDMFARALVGYATMDAKAMGLDTFIERVIEGGKKKRYITLNDTGGQATRIRLDRAMYSQKAIVSRGTTCYTTENNSVVKFAWASGKRTAEVDHLTQAKEKGVKGVAGIVAHHRIATIAEIRKKLKFPTAHRFQNGADDPSLASTSTSISGNKRKSSSSATETVSGSNKRQRSDSQKLNRKLSTQPSSSTSKTKPALSAPSEDLWEDRIYSCLVISPAGRVISEFTDIKQLLESMRDAIKAHQSLFVTGNILHRDISPNNIIITDPETADGFKGMLIDLDMAKAQNSGPSGARQITGTIQFMAIEVLRNIDHTYRHDLESFFYVLLWMCGRQSWHNGFSGNKKAPQESVFQQWEIGSFSQIARAKEGDMSGTFRRILEEFPEKLKVLEPLCWKIRDILFPYHEKGIIIGTPERDPEQLYRPIIAAYDETISEL
ncbi:serine/threonine-protein kinase Sgk2 [Sordaria sp. MPI-SDFR-AT-0083]|nr:serine/threonine-protein kinase Sgk2 [Sordaria sp. MPI-SDFR-AT-0083]